MGGIVEAANTNALGSGTVSINTGATRLVVNDGVTIANNIVINGGGVGLRGLIENSGAGNATVSGTITINGVSGGGDFASTGGGTLTVAGPIVSATTPVTSRLGTSFYSGGGSYSNFTLQRGTAMLGANNGLSISSAVDLGASGAAVFDLAGYNQSLDGMTKNSNGATIANSSTTSDSLLTLTGSSTYAGLDHQRDRERNEKDGADDQPGRVPDLHRQLHRRHRDGERDAGQCRRRGIALHLQQEHRCKQRGIVEIRSGQHGSK